MLLQIAVKFEICGVVKILEQLDSILLLKVGV